MKRVLSYLLICVLAVLGAALACAEENTKTADADAEKKGMPVSPEDAIVAETESFQIFCYRDKRCAASDVTAEQGRAAQQGLETLQSARGWLKGLGFDVDGASMDTGTTGKQMLRLQLDREKHEPKCDDMATACRLLSHYTTADEEVLQLQGRVILPIENVDGLAGGEVLVHEYVHTIQPARQEEKAHWLNEMVATAIGSAWVRKQTGKKEVYQPKYSMVLDREFWGGHDDIGYGKWDYAITLGERLGSRDGVAYLAQDRFINASNHSASRNGNNMALFFDKALVKGATFDTLFPEYVARFNNVEPGGPPSKERTGKYFYYGDIDGTGASKYLVDVPDMDAPFQTKFPGKSVPFAAHPVLLSLVLPSARDSVPADNMLLAEVEVTDATDADNLTLIREHRLAPEKLRDVFLIDGNNAPPELGFFRVAYTPPADTTAKAEFGLTVRTHPISIAAPACFQVATPAPLVAKGLEDKGADNWRVIVDNGSVEGLVITPTKPGKITVEIEIDSPITRSATGIAARAPNQTRIPLGSYDVVNGDCMVRLTIGDAIMTYVGSEGYTETTASGRGEAVYFSASDIAIWRAGAWTPIPPMAKEMLLTNFTRRNPALSMAPLGTIEDKGSFMAAMPKIWSERFNWASLRNGARAPGGGKLKRTRAACPGGGQGCSETVISMDGMHIPIVFDAQKRPKVVTFSETEARFEYGTWNTRRPPGW